MNISANNLYKNTLIIVIPIIVNNFFMLFFHLVRLVLFLWCKDRVFFWDTQIKSNKNNMFYNIVIQHSFLTCLFLSYNVRAYLIYRLGKKSQQSTNVFSYLGWGILVSDSNYTDCIHRLNYRTNWTSNWTTGRTKRPALTMNCRRTVNWQTD